MVIRADTRLVGLGDSAPHWIVVRTKPRREFFAIEHLQQRGVEPYCPLFLEPRWHPRAPKGPSPLFASYLFVHCTPNGQLNAVRYCPGILKPVTFDHRLASVDQSFISALRLREAERGYILPFEEEEGIPLNSPIKIMEGPFKGFDGIFQGYLKGGERALVLMELLRARHMVEVEACSMTVVRN